MSGLLIGLLGALAATNQPVALSNLVAQNTGISIQAPVTNDPVESQFQKIMKDDDAAEAEVDGWIRENNRFAAKGGGVPPAELNRRILARFEPIRQEYEDFIKAHPDHARARIAYASFLHDLGEEDGEAKQLEKALQLDPKDSATWNNLANYYGHNGSLDKAFAYYQKAIDLDPTEPLYYHNFGTTVFLFRKDARAYFHINEQQVFDKALELYAKAMKYDPTNFPLATDVAETYYGISPFRPEPALHAWTNALCLAHDEIEREGVYIHFARVETMSGRFAEARGFLNAVTNSMYSDLKRRLVRNLNEKEHPEARTNSPGSAPGRTARN